jgi:hypothetical protein
MQPEEAPDGQSLRLSDECRKFGTLRAFRPLGNIQSSRARRIEFAPCSSLVIHLRRLSEEELWS